MPYLLFFAIIAALIFFSRPTPLPESAGSLPYEAEAAAMLAHHQAAVAFARDNPTAIGLLSPPLPARLSPGRYRSCADANTVATTPTAQVRAAPALLARAASHLYAGAPGIGLASGGRVGVAPALYALPCAIPDGTATVATRVRD